MKTVPVSTTPKILLVDDSRDGLLVRRSLLQDAGCDVDIASCGEEALEKLRESRFDLVVTDHRMPRMSGTELIARIRALKPDARIILLSGFLEFEGLNEQNTGADAVVAKNFSEPAQLLRCVRRLVNAPMRKPAARQTAQSAGAGGRNLSH